MTNATLPTPGIPQASERSVLHFAGGGQDFIVMCLRGAALMLVTFGFYRFWLTTDIRRMLWNKTSFRGERFEYTGRAGELLIGFLIALAIFVPIGLTSAGIGIWFEQYQAFSSIPLVLFSVVFGQFALYRARRYRLSRTTWRGIRFWAAGSGWSYAFRWTGWMILGVLTLGLSVPWMKVHLERYKMRHTYFGDLDAGFDETVVGFWKFYWKYWVLLGLSFICVLVGLSGLGYAAAISETGGQSAQAGVVGLLMMASLLMPLGFLGQLILYPFYHAAEWRWWARGAHIGAARLQSTLRGGQLLYINVMWAIALFVTMFAFSIVIVLVMAPLAMQAGGNNPEMFFKTLEHNAGAIVAIVLSYLALLLGLGVVTRYFYTFCTWRAIAPSLSLTHPQVIEAAQAGGYAADAIGEGLADSFDIAF